MKFNTIFILLTLFIISSCDSDQTTLMSNTDYEEIKNLKLEGVVYDIYKPLIPQYHDYGIIRMRVINSNMNIYDARNEKDTYLLIVKERKVELYQPTSLFSIGDTVRLDINKKNISFFSEITQQQEDYEPSIYNKSFYDHIISRKKQKL